MGYRERRATNKNFGNAYKNYEGAIGDYQYAVNHANTVAREERAKFDKTADEQQNKYEQVANQYTGNNGYRNSVAQAKSTAADLSRLQAAGAANQARTAARNAGMSKAQAAALGTNQVANQYANAYGSNFNAQQSQAAAQGQNAVSAQLNGSQMAIGSAKQGADYGISAANTYAQNQGNKAQLYGQGAQMISTEYANEFNRNSVNNNNRTVGFTGLFGSDEMLKEYVKADDILKKHKKRDYGALKYKKDGEKGE